MSPRPNKSQDQPLIKARLLIVIMTTLCPVVCYMSRQNLSLAILPMVDSSHLKQEEYRNFSANELSLQPPNLLHNTISPTESNNCPAPKIVDQDGKETSEMHVPTYGPKYRWSISERSSVFESFWITYVIFQIPCARLAETNGAKWIMALAAFGSSILSLLTPLAASISVYVLALVRALLGVCQSAILPSCFVLYSSWLPPAERRRALPVVTGGVYIGSILATTTTGYFSEHSSFGWPWAFYMPSLLCFVWTVAWVFIGSSKPRDHWFISLDEIEFIESKMEIKSSGCKKSPDWKKIITSKSVLAMITAYAASNWAYTLTLQLLPTYLNDILLIPPFRNGVINSVIYILYIICSPIIGIVSSRMIETKALGLTHLQTRKLFESIGLFGQAACFTTLTFLGCNTQIVLALLYSQIVIFSFIDGGEIQLPSELSLDFAGTIYAIANCVGSCIGFAVTRIHSLMVTKTHDRDQWNAFFYLSASVTTIGGLVFLICGKNGQKDFSKKDDAKCEKNAHLQEV